MLVGHLAVAMGAKRAAPRAPLWGLVAASFGLDYLWPVLLLTGAETVRVDPGNTVFTPLDFVTYPWSHSLAMVLVWAAMAGVVTHLLTGSRRQAVVMGALLASHWVLDFVTHAPDLPLWPGGPEVGLGLWSSIPATLAVEGLLLMAGIWIYSRTTRPVNRVGTGALTALVIVLTLIWVSGPFVPPPPPSTVAIAVGALLLLLLPPWAAWIERHRRTDAVHVLPARKPAPRSA